MLRFAFKPRHPVTRVAFTADGREVVTAQPHTGIAVRDRLTGVARVTFPLPKAASYLTLAVHPICGLISARYHKKAVLYAPTSALFDPVNGMEVPRTESTPEGDHDRPEVLWEYAMWFRAGELVEVTPQAAGCPILSMDVTGRMASLNSPVRVRSRTANHDLLVFSPDGTKLALGDGVTLGVFDLTPLETATPEKPLSIHPLLTLERPDPSRHGSHADKLTEHWLPPVAFDHAGRSLFTLGLRNRVQRIDLATGGVMSEWGWRCEPIRSLAVWPDDLTAAAGCQRGELVMWDLE